MSQLTTHNDVPELTAVGAGGQTIACSAAAHGETSLAPRANAMFVGASNLQITGSTLTLAGRDVHNHYHSERPLDIWGILKLIPNFRKIYLDMLSRATPGTGLWLLRGKTFGIWLEPNGDIKIFWGSGIPGAGKTLLASIAIQYLESLYPDPVSARVCICYIYFRYSDHSGITVRTILETIVMQTLERHPGCQSLIEQTYEQHLRERTEPTEAQLLALLRELANYMTCTFYFFDAMDEAPTRIQLAILKALASLNVKLFITSRPLEPLQAHFPQAHTFAIAAQDADLDLHITKGIEENVELQRLVQASPLLRDEIFSTIKQNCGGMFLHASLQLDALHGCVSAHQVRRRLKNIPSSIKDVYHHTWNRICKQDEDLVAAAKTVLLWVLYASRSMTVAELELAAATCPDTFKFEPDRVIPGATLMSLCRGLIAVEEESGIVRLIHYTAKETVQNLLKESFPHPHSILAAVCMAHLTKCGFQDTTINSREEFQATLEEDPLLRYASEAWAFHAVASLDDDVSTGRIASFLGGIQAFPTLIEWWHFDILSPLHVAALYHLPLVLIEGVIEGNLNVASGVLNWSPLMLASYSGNDVLVSHLLEHPETQANLVDNGGQSALLWAAVKGCESIVKLLVARSEIQVNLVDNGGKPALIWAAYRGHEGIVKLLLARSEIQVNLVDNGGKPALIWAAYRGHEGIVKLLLARSEIQVNLVDHGGMSAFMWAAYRGYEGIAKLLLASSEIQVNLVNNGGLSALIEAARGGYEGIVKLLMARSELQVNLVNNSGQSALMCAANGGYEGIVKLLVARSETQVNLVNNRGASALIWAAYRGHEGIVKLLLAFACDVNTVDTDGDTAIKLAAQRGHSAVVRLLLTEPNIDITVRSTHDGHTAMSAAQAEGHADIAQLLQEFQHENAVFTSPTEASRVPLDDEARSDSDADDEGAYYDTDVVMSV